VRVLRIVFVPLRFFAVLLVSLVLVTVGGVGYMVNMSRQQPEVSGVSSPYYQGTTNMKMVSLTFNVDWGEEYLPQLLQILKDEDVKATFFLTGKWAEKQPDLVKQIVKDGHDLGNHGHGHRHLKNMSNEEVAKEISDAEKILQSISGQKPKLFAPAYGEIDERINRIAVQQGYEVIMWSLDTIDWQNPDVATIVKRVVPIIHNDAIILMHPTKPTVEALPQIIKQLKEEGYQLVPVSRLISEKADNGSGKGK